MLVDLASAPGRTIFFTRTKHGAKALARQLNKSGVPAVDLHGNLSQGARTRNLDAFHSGTATTLVATDIAARGIHVDDVALVVHADPPAEHKAYLHRSGRTARAGAAGTVITLMTDDQVRDVRDLTRAAGVKPTTTKLANVSHPVLQELAPGERTHPRRDRPRCRHRALAAARQRRWRHRQPFAQARPASAAVPAAGRSGGNRSGAPKSGGSGGGRSGGGGVGVAAAATARAAAAQPQRRRRSAAGASRRQRGQSLLARGLRAVRATAAS